MRALGAIFAAVPAQALAWGTQMAAAQTDIHAMFAEAEREGRVGLARKTRPVEVCPVQSGEVVVTVVAGEARRRKVRRRSRATWWCATAARRRATRRSWSAPPSSPSATRVRSGRPMAPAGSPRGIEMDYFVVRAADGTFTFTAPRGEPMGAHPGDAIVRNPKDPADTYRIPAAKFHCTYEILQPAS